MDRAAAQRAVEVLRNPITAIDPEELGVEVLAKMRAVPSPAAPAIAGPASAPYTWIEPPAMISAPDRPSDNDDVALREGDRLAGAHAAVDDERLRLLRLGRRRRRRRGHRGRGDVAWSFVGSATSSFLLSAEIARGPKGVLCPFRPALRQRRGSAGAACPFSCWATPWFPSIVGVVVNPVTGAAISALDHPRQAAFAG